LVTFTYHYTCSLFYSLTYHHLGMVHFTIDSSRTRYWKVNVKCFQWSNNDFDIQDQNCSEQNRQLADLHLPAYDLTNINIEMKVRLPETRHLKPSLEPTNHSPQWVLTMRSLAKHPRERFERLIHTFFQITQPGSSTITSPYQKHLS
jgi:hypothetical protein